MSNPIFEYDGAFRCTICGAEWGALPNPGKPCEHAKQPQGQPGATALQKVREALEFYRDVKNFQVTVWADESKDGDCWTEPATEHGLTEAGNSEFGIKAEEALEALSLLSQPQPQSEAGDSKLGELESILQAAMADSVKYPQLKMHEMQESRVEDAIALIKAMQAEKGVA